ncbi:MAG: hypothetical protein ACXAB4_14545 [Candidatus Hodarchaeales archaeon]|jgi:hypothetical protein
MDLEAYCLPICRVCGVYFSRKKCPFCEVTPFDIDYWHEKVSDLPEGALVGSNEDQEPRIAENQQNEMPSVAFQEEPSSQLVPEGEKKAAEIKSEQLSTAEESILEDETPIRDQYFEETSPTQEDQNSLERSEFAPSDVIDDKSHLTEPDDSPVEMAVETSLPEEEVPGDKLESPPEEEVLEDELESLPEEEESGPREEVVPPTELPDEELSESEPDDVLVEMALDYTFPEEEVPGDDLDYAPEEEVPGDDLPGKKSLPLLNYLKNLYLSNQKTLLSIRCPNRSLLNKNYSLKKLKSSMPLMTQK